MKSIFKLLLASAFIVSLFSCSNIKVLASWKADYSKDIKDNNVLVIAGINNAQARVAFKNEIADVMKAKGIKATPSFTVLPENMKLKQEQTEEAEMAFIKFLEYEW